MGSKKESRALQRMTDRLAGREIQQVHRADLNRVDAGALYENHRTFGEVTQGFGANAIDTFSGLLGMCQTPEEVQIVRPYAETYARESERALGRFGRKILGD